ncbi:MAG: hypothetical protein K2L54_01370, partial [Clostridiales bacterium]|nr:hypothetical protein [Clostridiales bacterium]
MIKQGIKNYFISLKCVFTPLGAFALGVVLGLSIFIPCVISAVSALCDDVVKIVGSVEADFDAMWAYIVTAVRALDWSEPLEAVNTVFSQKWLTDTLNGCLDSLLGGRVAFEEQLAAAVSVCLVRGGKMMGVKSFYMTDAGLGYADTVSAFIGQYYRKDTFIPSEICLPERIEGADALAESLTGLSGRKTEITFPKIGTKKSLLVCAAQNAEDFLSKSAEESKRKTDMTAGACERLAGILGIASAHRMECYDISNISGVDKVSSQVVFIGGAPSKTDYRKYKIKTVEGANDFASMEETLKRRFARAKAGDEKFSDLPDLIVIDGGKGQLSFAHEAMVSLGYDIPMVGLAKREEEIFTVGASEPIVLPKSDNALKLLQRIRDEAHRFAITYHRTLRKTRYVSQLEKIPNVGTVKAKILL